MVSRRENDVRRKMRKRQKMSTKRSGKAIKEPKKYLAQTDEAETTNNPDLKGVIGSVRRRLLFL